MRWCTLIAAASAFAPAPARRRLAPLRGGLSIDDGVSLLFVGGKGGVGKTSVSAAIAQRWSREGGRVRRIDGRTCRRAARERDSRK